MTDFDFHIPNRYDEHLASEGRWTQVIDEYDTLWGKFKLVMMDSDNPSIKKAIERFTIKAKNNQTKRWTEDEALVEIMIGSLLLDWEVKDSKGKLIPYSKEAAKAYFANKQVMKFVFPALKQFCGDVTNYKSVDEEQGETPVIDKDEVAGN